MFGIDALDIQSNAAEEALACSLCDAICQSEESFVKHMQEEHPENCTILKTSKSEDEYVEYEIISDDPLSTGEFVSGTDDDTPITEPVVPKRSLRTRSATKAKQAQVASTSRKPTKSSFANEPVNNITVVAMESMAFDEEIEYAEEFEHEVVTSESDIYECQHCATQFLDKNEYLDHCKEHEQATYLCDRCSEEFPDESSLMMHKCEITDEDLICVPCNKRMRSAAQMRQHSKMHDSMSLIVNYVDFFPCHDCCLLFIAREKLLEHNLAVHGSRVPNMGGDVSGGSDGEAFKKIDETCTDYQFLDDDKQNEYRDETYSCGECDVSSTTLNELKNHVLLHSEKFQCPVYECGCQYDQFSRLSIHVLNKHINTKNLQCLHCSLAFQSYDDLQAHIRHSCKEKKYECHECGKFTLVFS